jgi:hypothetical protein
MIKLENGGVIVNMSSVSRSGNIGQSNYAAAKAGVASMCVLVPFGSKLFILAQPQLLIELDAHDRPARLHAP